MRILKMIHLKKNKTTYRIDCTYNNERLCIDVRDHLSLLQALSSDKLLQLDAYTMAYLISINRSLLLTAENIENDTIKITSEALYKIKDAILNEDKHSKKREEALNKKNKNISAQDHKEAQNGYFGLVEDKLNEDELKEAFDDNIDEEDEENPE